MDPVVGGGGELVVGGGVDPVIGGGLEQVVGGGPEAVKKVLIPPWEKALIP